MSSGDCTPHESPSPPRKAQRRRRSAPLRPGASWLMAQREGVLRQPVGAGRATEHVERLVERSPLVAENRRRGSAGSATTRSAPLPDHLPGAIASVRGYLDSASDSSPVRRISRAPRKCSSARTRCAPCSEAGRSRPSSDRRPRRGRRGGTRGSRARHRRPFPANAHCPRSRVQTSRLTAAGTCREPGVAGRAGPWMARVRQLLPLEVLQQQRDRTVEDNSGIAIRHLMPQQVLDAAEFVVGVAADGELHLVSFRGERSDNRWTKRRRQRCWLAADSGRHAVDGLVRDREQRAGHGRRQPIGASA